MLAVRILNGSFAGKAYLLKTGRNRIGRSESTDFQIAENGISKEHLEITLLQDRAVFADLKSSNGTFLNGVKVNGGTLQVGDRIGLANILLEVIPAEQRVPVPASSRPEGAPRGMTVVRPQVPNPSQRAPAPVVPPAIPSHLQVYQAAPPVAWQQSAAVEVHEQGAEAPMAQALDARSTSQKFDDYVNQNLFPPLFQATEQFEFKMVVMAVLGVYVILITMLAIVPMKQITSDSIANESQRRAVTVGRALARGNEKALRNSDFSQFSTDFALHEDGVDDAYVLSKDGRILAPSERVGSAPKEAGFFHDRIQKANNKEVTGEVDGRVIAAIPIMGYDPELQQNIPRAYAVVIYNPGALAFDDGRVFSLFVQTLVLAIFVGGLVYFVLYRLIQYPFRRLNELLDQALRESRDQLQLEIQLPVLQDLMTNINSLLARALNVGSQNQMQTGAGAKHPEFVSLMALVGYPGMLLNSSGVILKCNPNFEALLGMTASQLENRAVDIIPDQAFQKSVRDLLDRAQTATGQVLANPLPIAGNNYMLSCQSMTTATGEVDCFIVTVRPAEAGEGSAA